MSEGFGRFITLFIILLILVISPMHSSGNDYKTVEKNTLRLFEEQKWDSVVIIGKQALKDDIDYFYLRLRMGISFFNLNEYYFAVEQLNKAVAFNSLEAITYQYLYPSYLRINRTEEAGRILKRMPARARESLNAQKNVIESLYFEGGPYYSSDDGRKPTPDLYGTDSITKIYGEEDLYENSYLIFSEIKINATPSVSVNFGYTYLDFKKIKNFQYGYFFDQLDSTKEFLWGTQNYYSFPKETKERSFEYHVRQHEFHLGITWALPEQILIKPAFHYIYDKYSSPEAVVKTTETQLVSWYTIGDSVNMFSFTRTNYSFPTNDTSFSNYVASILISKHINIFNVSLFGSYSNLNNQKQKQAGISLDYYPLGDLRFYGNTTVTSFFQNKDSRLLFQQKLGGNIWKGLWLEGSFIFGDLTNANVTNGSVVYNNVGRIKYIAGGSISYVLTKNLSAVVNYRYSEKESLQNYFSLNAPSDSQPFTLHTKYNKYSTNTLTIGIRWKF